MSGHQAPPEEPPDHRRRRLLASLALAGLAGTGAAGAWYATRSDDDPEPTPTSTPGRSPTTTETPSDGVPAVVRRYAPDLYFGELERWYPTDPRPYVVETADGPVVDGFTALDGYAEAFAETGRPPAPTVFYHLVEAADGVDAVQYWMYSVFDQFAVNFHWHDWELLQVFVERDAGRPLLLSASAHARSVPNNEYLDPPGDRRPGVLAEVGSHSSASGVNERVPTFERLSGADWDADVTNGRLDVTLDLSAPSAYGLPRGEGAKIPFVMPTLDGTRLDEHPALSVTTEDFVSEAVTVGSWHGLPRPPTDLPSREPGLVMGAPDSSAAVDATYQLLPMRLVEDAVEGFVGPQLRFEFVVPGFLEDRFADHLTSVGIPWRQDRYTDPLADVTEPRHRERLEGSAPASLRDRVVGRVRHLGSGPGGALDDVTEAARAALGDAITVSLFPLPVEVVTQLASEAPVATVTGAGVFAFLHVSPGRHRLVVNGPGYAPLALGFVHEGGLLRAGAAGDLTVVSTADAAWIRVDGRPTTGVRRVRVVETFAGVVYDGRPVEEDRFAVAVHQDGSYTVELVDRDGRPGAFRVGPGVLGEEGEVIREDLETGKASLARTLRGRLDELRDLAERLSALSQPTGEVLERLSLAIEAADAATGAAVQGDARTADERLSRVVDELAAALEVLRSDRQGGYTDGAVATLEPRVVEAVRRARLAMDTGLPG